MVNSSDCWLLIDRCVVGAVRNPLERLGGGTWNPWYVIYQACQRLFRGFSRVVCCTIAHSARQQRISPQRVALPYFQRRTEFFQICDVTVMSRKE